MTLNAELLTIIVCPNCRGEVDYDEPQQVIECRECHYRYPVRDDIPVLLVDEAEKPAGDTGAHRPAGSEGPSDQAAGRPATDVGTPADDA